MQLNRDGTIQVTDRFDGRTDVPWKPTGWDEYLRADPRAFLDRLERAAGLPTPSHVPPSNPTTLTYRKSVHPIDIQSGQFDSSGYDGGPNDALDVFPVPDELRRTRPDDLFGHASYRFWIVSRDRVPILAFEQDGGLAWTQHHNVGFDLMAHYKSSRHNLLVVTFELLQLVDSV